MSQEEWNAVQRRIYTKVDTFLKHLNQIEREVMSGEHPIFKERMDEIAASYDEKMKQITMERDQELALLDVKLAANLHSNQCDLQDEIETEKEDMLEELEDERDKVLFRQLKGFCSPGSISYGTRGDDDLSSQYRRLIREQQRQRRDLKSLDDMVVTEYKFNYLDAPNLPRMELSSEQIAEDLREINKADDGSSHDAAKFIPLEIKVTVDGRNVTVGGTKYTVGQIITCCYHQYCSFQGVIDSVDPHKIVIRQPRKCEKIPLILIRRGIVQFSETKEDCPQ